MREILDFPANDLIIKQVNKKIRTLQHVVPKEELGTLPLYVQQCVNCFTRPWKVVEFSHRKHSNSCCFRDRSYKALTSPLDQQEYEIDADYSSFDDSTLMYRVSGKRGSYFRINEFPLLISERQLHDQQSPVDRLPVVHLHGH